jgi:hypothetical protein
VTIHLEGAVVVTVETVTGAEPRDARAVLGNGDHGALISVQGIEAGCGPSAPLSEFGELRAVKDPGQVDIFGCSVIVEVFRRYDTPEILPLQFREIGSLDEDAFHGIPCFKKDFRRCCLIIPGIRHKSLDLFNCHKETFK